MKKILIAFFILVVTVITAGTMFNHTVESLLKKVKISEDEAQNQIFYNISSPANVYFPNLKELKSIALNERPEIVQLVFKRIKSFTAAPEFMARYNEYREMKKPSPPEEPQSADDMKEQQIKQMKESIASMEDLKKTMPDQAAAFEETIQSMKQQLKEIDNPENQTYTMMAQYMQQSYGQQLKDYELKTADWKRQYPDNPAPMIRTWLTNFLNESSTVDFNAELIVEPNGRKLFADKEYEKKSYLWKLCFRAGKETVNAARTAAQSWLNEL